MRVQSKRKDDRRLKMIEANDIPLFFGTRTKTKKNMHVLVRKRIFHKGYQISEISYNNSEELFTEVQTCELFAEVQVYLNLN